MARQVGMFDVEERLAGLSRKATNSGGWPR